MAGRRHEAEAEALDIVERVVQRMDLELAAVARACVHMPDREASPERMLRCLADRRRKGGELRVVLRRSVLGDGRAEALEQRLAHL